MDASETGFVSVIVPNFNHRRHLPRRLQSIREQTYRRMELILLDDASTDGSDALLSGYATDVPTQYIRNDRNSGSVFRQWAKGVQQARGEFVWIAEADDDASPRLLVRLVEALTKHPTAGLAYAQSVIIDPQGRDLEAFLNYTNRLDRDRWKRDYFCSGREEVAQGLAILNTIPNASAVLFRRRVLQSLDLEAIGLRLCGDWLMYAQILRTHDVAFIAEALNRYRRHPATVRSATDPVDRMVETYQVIDYIRRNFHLPVDVHERACRLHAEEVRHVLKGASGNATAEGIARLTAAARAFDPFFRVRVDHDLRGSRSRSGGAADVWSTWLAGGTADQPRRVLLVLPHLELGGADRFNLDLVQGLLGRGWEITIVTTRRSPDGWLLRFARLCPVLRLPRLFQVTEYPAFLLWLLAWRKPRVVFLSHSVLGYGLLPWLSSVAPALPVVDLVHIADETWRQGGYPRLSIRHSSRLARTLATSGDLRDWMVERGAERNRIDVVHTNVDPSHWAPSGELSRSARLHYQLPEDVPVVLFAARFSDQKQPHLLNPIVEELKARGTKFLLLFVGDGPRRRMLDGLCVDHADCCRMLGEVAPDEMKRILAASSILLLPSRSEGIALVLFEAMSMGVVPVTTDVGGQRELVTRECGVLLPNDHLLATRAAEAIAMLLRDRPRLSAMGAAARQRVVAHHALADTIEQVHELLDRVKASADPVVQAASADAEMTLRQALDEAGEENQEGRSWSDIERRLIPRLVSRVTGGARNLPVVGRWIRRLESRYGERVGRWLAEWC